VTTGADGGRLVIVDDEPVILEMLSAVFEDEPYEVVAVPDGASARAAFADGGVDVLLTDKNLPDINGLQLLREARQSTPDVEVIIITGYASLDTALEAMQLGAFDYIVKPPKSIFDVLRKVNQAFGRQAIIRENRRLVEDLRAKNEALHTALEDLKAVQGELIQSEKLAGIGTLAAGIAHEISSPLFGVMGLAEAIADEDELGIVREYASDIVEYSRAIKEIVVQLSGYSRAADRDFDTSVDLAQVMVDAVRLVCRSAGVPDDCVELAVEDELLISAKPNEVQQVLVNLVKNAVEAGAEAGGSVAAARVKLTARAEGAHVVIEVADNGVGIAPEMQKAIFDPFYTTKPPGKGTGLGLNIVYRIVTKYRGTIHVRSDLGVGATMVLRFPASSG